MGAALPELDALDALDEALASRLVVPAGAAETYAFVRTLIRRTVYGELSPSRQVRLHRRAAEALEAAGPALSGEIAVQYHQSRTLPGANRGAVHAVAAADQAQATGGYDEAATMLRMALDIVPEDDPRRPASSDGSASFSPGRLPLTRRWPSPPRPVTPSPRQKVRGRPPSTSPTPPT